MEKSLEKSSDAKSDPPAAEVTINGPEEEDGQSSTPPPNGTSPRVGDGENSGVELRKRNVHPYVYE